MFKRMLALMLAAMFLILPLHALAISETEWNEGCRFKTKYDTTLYSRDPETGEFKELEPPLDPNLPANSYISVVSTEVDGKRQISFFRDNNAQYAWIDKDAYTWAVKEVEIEDGNWIRVPELAWGNEQAIRRYMSSFYKEEEIQKVLAAMLVDAGVTDNSTPAPVVPTVTQTPAVQVTAAAAVPEVQQVQEPVAAAAETPAVPVAAAPAATEVPAAPAPTATPVPVPAAPAAVSGLVAAGVAATPWPDTSYLPIRYTLNGQVYDNATLIRLGAVSSLIAIGQTAYLIATEDIEWESNAEQGTRVAVVSNIEMSSAWLRQRGNLEGKRLSNVPAGAVVAVLDNVNSENYTHVYYGGRIGYISNGLLSYSDGEDPIAHGVLSIDGSTVGTGTVNVWVHPNSTTSFLVGKWTVGTVVDVLEYNDDWIRVEVDGFQGWVSSKYINLQ